MTKVRTYGREPVVEALKAAMEARVPVMAVGAPGVGKTATIRALAIEMGYTLITLLGSSMDPTDINGLPAPSKMTIEDENGEREVGITTYLAPWWAAKTLAEKKVIIFLDEYSNAPPAVQASMLTFLQDREFGDGTKLPPETIVIAAMNPMSSAVSGVELASPTVNRIVFLPWHTSHESWYEGMLDAWGEKVSPREMTWRRRIVNFIKAQPFQLHKEPDEDINVESYGVNPDDEINAEIARMTWPSRRSWDNLSKLLATAPDNNYVQDMIAQGTVGWGAAQDFRIWLQQNDDTLSLSEVLKDPNSVDWDSVGLNDGTILFTGMIDIINRDTTGPVLKTINSVINSGNAGLVGPYYQEIFKKVTDPNIVGEETAGKAIRAVQQLLTKLSPYLSG